MVTLLAAFICRAESNEPMRLVFLGDSLTSGYTLDADLAYPGLIQQRINTAGLPFTVINSGVSADTTAGGLSRLDWLLRQPIDVLVVALGANDGLRGFDPSIPEKNLRAIIEKTRASQPSCLIKLIGMKLPRNMGDDYVNAFERIFFDLSMTYGVELMPFLLEGVAGDPNLNMPDGIHPLPEGHQIMAKNVWNFLEPSLIRLTKERK
jgi:acyl-CoA thioesterase-1